MNTLKHLRRLFRKNGFEVPKRASNAHFLNAKLKEEAVCNQAVKEAEKIVGYPTSFLSLRWLLNDEVANIAMHIRKLVGTNHPLLKTARMLLLKGESPPWGLIVLLVSKVGGLKSNFSQMECDLTAGILHSQRVLAEVTEMIRTSHIVHNSLLNLNENSEDLEDLNFGNKIALLSGDYLLSTSFRELAGLKNQEVNEIISTSLRDLAEAEFIEPRDKQNRPLPCKPLTVQKEIDIPNELGSKPFKLSDALGNTKSEWTLRHLLGGASLLAKCCQGTLRLAGHSEDVQEQGYTLGRNLALAWQARADLAALEPGNYESFSLISAPVMFHLRFDPDFYEEIIKGIDDLDKLDYKYIREVLMNGPGIQETENLKKELCDNAIKILENFPNNDAKVALTNMISAM